MYRQEVSDVLTRHVDDREALSAPRIRLLDYVVVSLIASALLTADATGQFHVD